ncbi:MAG TPA: OpgC domain-containing protein [Candidatus Saccharimonadales bacterium]|nr:OpgC domain-containing protein [Candidatus Saccharimonadales bacterium]
MSKRLTTLDFLRGFFLFVIIVDHVELYPSGFDFLTGRGRLWVSAAEGFFFISGLLVSYIYRKKLLQGSSFVWIWTKMWRRAAQLYACAVSLTLLFSYWAVASGDKGIKYGLPAVINWPHMVWQTLTLQYSFGWADFLPHYVVFMLAAPVVFFLLAKRQWWLVVLGSAAIWTQRGQEFVPAWQIIFVGGMITGFYWDALCARCQALSPRTQRVLLASLFSLTAVTFICSYLSVFVLSELNAHFASLAQWQVNLMHTWDQANTVSWRYLEKWTMEPGRMITFGLWFATSYILCQRYAKQLQQLTYGVLETLGRHSLFVYALHALVIFVLHLALHGHTNLWQNMAITASVLGVIVMITYIKDNLDALGLPHQEPQTNSALVARLVVEKLESE